MIPETLESLAVPVGSLKPYGRNPRQGDVGQIVKSLERHGQYRPIVVNARTQEVLAGNHTLQAALALGWSEIAATFVDVDDDTAARIVLVDNRSNDLAAYDDHALVELLRSLPDLEGTGFDGDDLDELLQVLDPVERPSGDTEPGEPPADPRTKLGDVYVLGDHRLVCGDSTDSLVLDAVLVGERPAVVFTDPPYGIAYKAMRGGADIANDADEGSALAVTRDALALAADAEAHFVCCDWRSMPTMLDAMSAVGIEPKCCIVWDKQSRVQNLDRYAKQHEFILYAGPYGGQPTVATDVWQFQRDFDPDHPTPKPVDMIERAVDTASDARAVVLDLFGGSGSTLIACENRGRKARLVELDPAYCDVIVDRWERHTGKTATLEEAPDGSPVEAHA